MHDVSDSVTALAPLRWADAFLLGHPPMDDIHADFVRLVGALQCAGPNQVAAALAEVCAHLDAHFAEEEAWMRASHYPALDCHVAEHAAVLASARDVSAQLAQGNAALCRRFADELAQWFPGHADYLDAPLAQWLTHKRFGGVPVVLKRDLALRAA